MCPQYHCSYLGSKMGDTAIIAPKKFCAEIFCTEILCAEK